MNQTKLEGVIDLLAVHGNFNREYLRDRLLSFVNDGQSENTNKMEQVAVMFGKEINEPFHLESNVHKVTSVVRFSEDGMQYFDNICQRWYPTEAFLREILTGQAVIVGGDVNNADRKE